MDVILCSMGGYDDTHNLSPSFVAQLSAWGSNESAVGACQNFLAGNVAYGITQSGSAAGQDRRVPKAFQHG